jgi:hypothetical protein
MVPGRILGGNGNQLPSQFHHGGAVGPDSLEDGGTRHARATLAGYFSLGYFSLSYFSLSYFSLSYFSLSYFSLTQISSVARFRLASTCGVITISNSSSSFVLVLSLTA